MSNLNGLGPAPDAESERNSEERKAWSKPAIEVLPRLENLTLQTGSPDTTQGFTYL